MLLIQCKLPKELHFQARGGDFTMVRARSMEDINSSEYVTIGELVRLTNSRYITLKYYTEEGMIPFEQAGENLIRRYKRSIALERIELILSLKKLNLSIPEIKLQLKQYD